MTRLYHFALSPFCRKVRLVLAEKKIDVELIDEDGDDDGEATGKFSASWCEIDESDYLYFY